MLSSPCKKKLYKCRPQPEATIEIQSGKRHRRPEPCDSVSIERGVRQLLADKVSDTLLGLWLLVPEHLRLKTWDLLVDWSGAAADQVDPRLGLQLVHEAALCRTGVRRSRCLTQKGFAVLNGLPFLASDEAVHDLLNSHTVEAGQRLQVHLGKLRRASGHFQGKLLAIDPHRTLSHSRRQMRRHRKDGDARSHKIGQTFFCLDAQTKQPVCFTTGSASRTVTQATPLLLDMAADILGTQPGECLALGDNEHFSLELLDQLRHNSPFDLLVPQAKRASLKKELAQIPQDQFTPRWAGYATAKRLYQPAHCAGSPHYQFVQRFGERSDEWTFSSFICTSDRDEVEALTGDFPQRWHVEEFFNKYQALGWNRAGTMNLNVRYNQMTMALVAQAAIHQFQSRLDGEPSTWDSQHLAAALFQGLDGDLRVTADTIIVTYYNAPHADRLRLHYEGLPDKLLAEGIDPRIPWLYNYRLDFRFR